MRLRAFVLWLALALVLAQALGLMHRVVHAPLGNAPAGHANASHVHQHRAQAQAQLVANAQGSAHAGPLKGAGAQHGVASLFASHDDDSTCRLLDAAGHDLAAGCLDSPAVQALPAFWLALRAGEALARWAALYNARGPPPVH